MYYYAEVLRGKRALRVIAIILGICLAIAIVLRLWAFSEHNLESLATALQSSPTAHATVTTLADGTIRTVVDDPVKHVHAVIDRRGQLFHMEATMPSAEAPRHNHFSLGSSIIDVNKKAGTSHIVMTHDMSGQMGIGILFAISAVIGLITATMLGGTLAKENDGHLELAWTKPVSRDRLALASMAVDMLTIVISQVAAVVLILICILMFVAPRLYANSLTPAVIGLALIGPIAWYACLTAFSASMRRGLGLVCGLGWLAAIVVPSVAQGTAYSVSDLGRTVHAITQAIAYIDPIAYLSFHGSLSNTGMQFQTAIGSIGTSALILVGLTAIYVVLAVLQWRRVEA